MLNQNTILYIDVLGNCFNYYWNWNCHHVYQMLQVCQLNREAVMLVSHLSHISLELWKVKLKNVTSKRDTFIYATTSLKNTCDKPLLLWGRSTAPSQMCQRYRRNCDVDYSNCLRLPACLSLWLSGCLSTCLVPSTSVPLDSRNMSYFSDLPRLTSLFPLLSFFS